jgi:hypothetical protein
MCAGVESVHLNTEQMMAVLKTFGVRERAIRPQPLILSTPDRRRVGTWFAESCPISSPSGLAPFDTSATVTATLARRCFSPANAGPAFV